MLAYASLKVVINLMTKNVRIARIKRIYMLVKALRNGLGLIIVGIDKVTRPKPLQRSPEDQLKAQALVEGHSLYQLFACPFCVKTAKFVGCMNLTI